MKRKYSDEEIKNYIIDREMKNIRKNRQIENIIKTSMKYTEFSIKQKMITRSIEPGFLVKKRQFQLMEIFNRETFSNIYDKFAIKNHRYVYAAVLVLFVVVITPKIMKQSQESSFVASEVSEVQESAPVLENLKAKKSISENILKEVSDNKSKQVELSLSGNVAVQNRSEKADVVEPKEKTEKLQVENEIQSAPSAIVEEFKAEKSISQDNAKEEAEISMKDISLKTDEDSFDKKSKKGVSSEKIRPRMEAKRSLGDSLALVNYGIVDEFQKNLKYLAIYKGETALNFQTIKNGKIVVLADIDENGKIVDFEIIESDIPTLSKNILKVEIENLQYTLTENGNKIKGKIKYEIKIENETLKSLKILDITE